MSDFRSPSLLFVGHRVWDELLPKTYREGMRHVLALPHGPVDVFPDALAPSGRWYMTTGPYRDDVRPFFRSGTIDPPPTVVMRSDFFDQHGPAPEGE